MPGVRRVIMIIGDKQADIKEEIATTTRVEITTKVIEIEETTDLIIEETTGLIIEETTAPIIEEEKGTDEKVPIGDLTIVEMSVIGQTPRGVEMIDTTDIPIRVKRHRRPPAIKEEMQRQINKYLDEGIIRPSDSPYSSMMRMVPKKSGKNGEKRWRMVTDFHQLNDVIAIHSH